MNTSTQVQHPNRASVRTFIQTLIPALVLVFVAVPPFVDIVLDEVGKAGVELPEWLYLALTGASVACALVAAIVARVMAIPGVEKVLERFGVGTTPKAKRLAEAEADATPVPDDYKPKH
ncbi:hypothetical protein BSP239C_03169 [Brevibacterium sp. 239c]|uniref:hypothetical protein n=1 Tax=Brevibacterium sp. 239c TaxID=1965356 RepID=UPI000C3C6DBA|nr:hypothetical protein [Brevibacterium sp. 239c]SMY01018.1 hypothetical protein BSP239C_03169 [Brevibacterium sp. 239c]